MDTNIRDIPGEEDVRRAAEAHLVGKATKDPAFRQELIQNPRRVISKELGVELPGDFDIKVLEETSKSLYLVLPVATEKDELSDQMLEAVAAGCYKGKQTVQPADAGPTDYNTNTASEAAEAS
jgi:hypothetical protein